MSYAGGLLEAPATLTELLSTLKASVNLVARGSALSQFDMHCPLESLPLAFSTRVETIPRDIPYIYADPFKCKMWQERLGKKLKPRVGLVWSGSATHKNDRNRSIPINLLAPLLWHDCEFHSLQKETRPDDAAFLQEYGIIPHNDSLLTFSDTAALATEMDVVISVDTSVTHLAGALGKPVWVLLPYAPDFRWMTEREDSLWYPTARLFRQTEADNWIDVIARVKTELEFYLYPIVVNVN